MVRIRTDLGYAGGAFRGFQRQPDQVTVQGTLEDALQQLLGIEVATTCAGRTDAGVHAIAQVAHFDAEPSTPRAARLLGDLDDLRVRLDAMAGPDIAVWSLRAVAEGFDARFSANARRYVYRLCDAAVVEPRLRGLRWHVGQPLDVAVMQAAADLLLGEHDFAAYCREPDRGHTVRRLDAMTVVRDGDRVDVDVSSRAFCHQQVRAMVGCLVAVGTGERPPGWVRDVLESRDRGRAAAVAPPHGLTLEEVRYDGWPGAPPGHVRTALRGRAGRPSGGG